MNNDAENEADSTGEYEEYHRPTEKVAAKPLKPKKSLQEEIIEEYKEDVFEEYEAEFPEAAEVEDDADVHETEIGKADDESADNDSEKE